MKERQINRLIYEVVRPGVDDAIHAKLDHPSIDPHIYDHVMDHVYTPVTGEIWEPIVLTYDALRRS